MGGWVGEWVGECLSALVCCSIALLHAALLPCCMLAVANNICLCADVLACRGGRFLLLL